MTGFSVRGRQNWLFVVGLFCFFFSGAAGLIYQVVWTRMLTQIFGNTTYAIATVLSAFMAGLAIGSYVFGQIADRGKNDFLLYGILEAGVGIYGFAVPYLFGLAQKAYGPIFGLNESYPFLFNLVLFFLSFVLLVFPTLLMGATLPVLSRFYVRSFADFGRRVGDLYATNTLGAVIGCAAGGFLLIPTMGMRATVYTAAGVNLAIALLILAVDRIRDKDPGEAVAAASAAEEPAGSEAGHSWLRWAVLVAFGLSGFASLVYENAWTRALTLVIGSSIYSFTTMLVTFLIGLALGGFIYARSMGEREARLSGFGLLEVWVGLAALATIPMFERLPLIFVRLLEGFGDTFTVFLYLQIFLSSLVMFVPTLLLGMTFPMVARLFTQSLYRVGSGVGSSYAANTVGAVAGAFAGGFILIPNIGVQNTILFAVMMNLLIGCALVFIDPRMGKPTRLAFGGSVLALAVLVPERLPRWDRHILTSGVTIYHDRYESLPTNSLRLEEMRRDEILYYREGLTTTVSVHRIPGSDYIYFKSNGKIDGSYGDALSQLMTSYIPMMLHPDAEVALTIGLGSGMSAKALATFPTLKEIEVIEIEPAMIEASRFFDRVSVPFERLPEGVSLPSNGSNSRIWYDAAGKRLYYKGVMKEEERSRLMKLSEDRDFRGAIDRLFRSARQSRHDGVLEDKRVRVIPTDGRNYILATPKYYDVITAEPSNPWIAGIANLYTREFYEVIKSKIKDDGIFGQWFHNYSMSPDDFRMVFRTFSEVFPHVSLWSMKESDFLLIGSKREQVFDYRKLKEIYERNEKLRSDLEYLGLSDIYAVQGFYRLNRDGFVAFAKGADINTDDGAELEFSAPKNLRRATTELNRRLMAPFVIDAPWLKSRPLPVPEAMHHFYMAQAFTASSNHARALTEIGQAIQRDPKNPKFYLLQMKILLEQDKSAEAAKAALAALERDPGTIPEVLAMSDEFYLPEAKTVYSRIIQMGTREILPYLGLGNIALHSGELAEAEKWFTRARAIDAEHPAVLLAWGRLVAARAARLEDAARMKAMLQEARELLERSKAKGEESPTLHSELGEVYFRLQMWDRAAESYAEALRMRRRRNDWRINLGRAYAQLGKIDQAEQKYREVLAFSPDDTEAWKGLHELGRRY
ncbi:MAG TPA: fused MFS/spermidine synthase [candidate division Zixibacteria bacterium]|nr:fused MFS/spermidine synthase [candidate division Zixibacteria bacterium]